MENVILNAQEQLELENLLNKVNLADKACEEAENNKAKAREELFAKLSSLGITEYNSTVLNTKANIITKDTLKCTDEKIGIDQLSAFGRQDLIKQSVNTSLLSKALLKDKTLLNVVEPFTTHIIKQELRITKK